LNLRKVLKETEESLRSYLGLRGHLVGVELEKTREISEDAFKPEMPMAFCQMIREASFRGNKFLYGLEHEKCPTAQLVLGLKGFRYLKADYKIVPSGTKKILISPLSEIDVMPDVALAILNPRQIMNLSMIFYAVEGKSLSSEFTGEHACAEFFAEPYVDGKPNISFLCSGAREVYSDHRDDEAAFGAPLGTFIRASEMMKKLDEMGGSLCGCRTSDIPAGITGEFEKIGFSKGSGYFFGKFNGRNVRVYLNRDANGRINLITIHFPIKTSSQEEAEELAKRLTVLLSRPYYVNVRGRWLDLTVRSSMDALGIDLFDSSSLKIAIERFVNKIGLYLNKVKI